jgi:hypothetical protein
MSRWSAERDATGTFDHHASDRCCVMSRYNEHHPSALLVGDCCNLVPLTRRNVPSTSANDRPGGQHAGRSVLFRGKPQAGSR